MSETGVGARVLRKEDDRLMRGRGRFVGDIAMDGMGHVAFVRSPVAHARIAAVEVPDAHRGHVYLWPDLEGVKPIYAVARLPGFKASDHYPLAHEKVRHVGEMIAMCVGATRAEAEDIAAEVLVEFQDLPAVTDMVEGRAPDAPRVHEGWEDNVIFTMTQDGDIDAIRQKAAVTVNRVLRTHRQCMSPLEGKGALAYWDRHVEQLVVYSSAQMTHVTRTGLAEHLGLDEGSVRVIAPDVGGGFGDKGLLNPEEVCVAWLAMRLDRPLRWTEDRREHLTASARAREHHYDLTAYADKNGKLLALDCVSHVDAGAYSMYPFTACIEGAQIVSILPGPYDIEAYRCTSHSVATNKPPITPYRGVARPGVCFAVERIMDAVANEVGREPYEVRLESLVTPESMPFTNIAGKEFDSGDYPESLRRAVKEIDLAGWRQRQKRGEEDGRLIGIGVSIFNEQGAHGTPVYYSWGIPLLPGYEQVQARFTQDGVLEIRTGVHSHGQSLETTLAQVANEVLGIDLGNIKIVFADTALTPYSTGTWGSRCAVKAGGATAASCKVLAERCASIGAHLLQSAPESVRVEDGKVVSDSGSVTLAEVAFTWYREPHQLPEGVDPGGLDVTTGFKNEPDTGTFSYAAHAAAVAIDPEVGAVEILDYVVVEDAGRMINPMVVDGQIFGGSAQGIGTAFYEEMPFDEEGQPLASTLADYLLPGATEVPEIRVFHMETPSPYTEFGVKGIGEGGAIAPAGALANAVNDALKPLGTEVNELPMTPRRILAAIGAAGPAEAAE